MKLGNVSDANQGYYFKIVRGISYAYIYIYIILQLTIIFQPIDIWYQSISPDSELILFVTFWL
jgi:hypothetical protein